MCSSTHSRPQAATLNAAQERGVAAQRKAANIQGSAAHGLPGSVLMTRPGTSAGALGGGAAAAYYNTTAVDVKRPQSSGLGYQWSSPGLGDSASVNLGTVNLTTMGGGGGGVKTVARGMTAYEALENRPLQSQHAGSLAGSQKGGARGAGRPIYGGVDSEGDGDHVLLGTVTSQQGMSQRPGSRAPQASRGAYCASGAVLTAPRIRCMVTDGKTGSNELCLATLGQKVWRYCSHACPCAKQPAPICRSSSLSPPLL
jgi:hypothetical protein